MSEVATEVATPDPGTCLTRFGQVDYVSHGRFAAARKRAAASCLVLHIKEEPTG
jgi:hypothetical protein